jgi:hypothetical protein
MTTENTSLMARENLAEAEAAITEFDRVQAGIADLKTKFAGVIFPVATTAGMKEAITARAAVREPRIATEKARKAGKAPLLALGKLIDEKAKWITAELVAIEDPIDEQIKSEEVRKEAERQAKLQAEQARIDRHRAGIEAIRFHVVEASGSCAKKVQNLIDQLGGIDVGDGVFEEFAPAAHKAKAETLAALRELLAAANAREAEAACLQAEREELARQRAEQEARDAAERVRIAAEQQAEAERLAAERAAFAQEQRISREKQAELDRQAEAVRREADARAAQERAAADRQAADARAEADALLQQARAAEAARMAAARAEVERITEAARQAEADRLTVERAAQEAEAARLRAIEDAERQRIAEARARTNALRGELDALLDTLGDDDLHEVMIFARGMAQREQDNAMEKAA